jgi:hypothetical protein
MLVVVLPRMKARMGECPYAPHHEQVDVLALDDFTHSRVVVRRGARSMHVCLHGADARHELQAAAANFLYGAALLLAYGVGHCAVIVPAGTSTELVQRFLNWKGQSKGLAMVKAVCGVLALLGGAWLIDSAP